jgi:SAM-dependent methyltransferase
MNEADKQFCNLRYNSKSRWLSYWYQISGALENSPESVLVIGKGSSITENTIRLLSDGKISITTLDIDSSLAPDVVGSVTELPFEDGLFDTVICCQVLEHLPFEKFPVALRELQRVCGKRVILSLPHGRKFFRFSISVPYIGEKTIIIKYPFTKRTISSKEHLWEIRKVVSRRHVVKKIKCFFDIEKEFLNEINCYHRFFILKKKESDDS